MILLSNGGRVVATVNDAIGNEWLGGGWFCLLDYANAHADIVRPAIWANDNPEQYRSLVLCVASRFRILRVRIVDWAGCGDPTAHAK